MVCERSNNGERERGRETVRRCVLSAVASANEPAQTGAGDAGSAVAGKCAVHIPTGLLAWQAGYGVIDNHSPEG